MSCITSYTCEFCKKCFKTPDLFSKHTARKTICISKEEILKLLNSSKVKNDILLEKNNTEIVKRSDFKKKNEDLKEEQKDYFLSRYNFLKSKYFNLKDEKENLKDKFDNLTIMFDDLNVRHNRTRNNYNDLLHANDELKEKYLELKDGINEVHEDLLAENQKLLEKSVHLQENNIDLELKANTVFSKRSLYNEIHISGTLSDNFKNKIRCDVSHIDSIKNIEGFLRVTYKENMLHSVNLKENNLYIEFLTEKSTCQICYVRKICDIKKCSRCKNIQSCAICEAQTDECPFCRSVY